MTIKQVRGAMEKLKNTGEVGSQSAGKFSIITLLNWDEYQTEGQLTGQSQGRDGAGFGQALGRDRATSKECKNERTQEGEEKKKKANFSYSSNLQELLLQAGILHLEKYEAEGLTENHWFKALDEGLREGALVGRARAIKAEENIALENQAEKEAQKARMEENKAWFNKYRDRFPEEWEPQTLYVMTGGSSVNFADKDFKEKLKEMV